MTQLSAPAKPPVPAKDILATHPQPAVKPIRRKKILSKFIKKKYLVIAGVIGIGLLILLLLVNLVQIFQKQAKRKSQQTKITPTPYDAPHGASPIFPTEDIPTTGIRQTPQPGWQKLSSDQGGFTIDYPQTLTLQSSTDIYSTLQPVWYEDAYYFDCINRQVGSTNPFPCWLLQIDLTIADPLTTTTTEIPNYNNTYTDSQSRTWQTTGPQINFQKSTYIATITIDDTHYRLHTQTVLRSLRQFIRNHPDQLFGFPNQGADDQSLAQLHQNLIQQMLATFQIFRKPFLPEPTWLRTRFDSNWSVAYPENWLLNPNPIPEPAAGYLTGWYGSGKAVSFHQYTITLITPDLSSYPESALKKLDNWAKYEIEQLPTEFQDQIKIIKVQNSSRRVARRSPIEVKARLLLNYPETSNSLSIFNDTPHGASPTLTHRALIWPEDSIPHRIVIIKQPDPYPEPVPMQRLIDTFVKRVYE